jgi:ubiquitin-protein ligase
MSLLLSDLTTKRLQADLKILHKDPREDSDAFPDESNMLIWYFLLRGTGEYKDGWYLGKILHDKQYPLKAPDIQLLTPSGRYETNINICLTFTKFHESEWSAMWNVRTLLDGLYSNMNDDQKTEQGIGYMKRSSEERATFAKESVAYNMKYYPKIFTNFTRFINIDGTPKTDEEIKLTLKPEKKKKETQ